MSSGRKKIIKKLTQSEYRIDTSVLFRYRAQRYMFRAGDVLISTYLFGHKYTSGTMTIGEPSEKL